MRKKNIYIVLEGLDGSGKSTLFKGLVTILREKNISFDTLCPTQVSAPDSLPEKIYRSNKKFKRINFFRTLIFAYRSYKAVKKVDWSSRLILGDRSVVVSYVKHWRKIFNIPFLSVLLVNILESSIPSPDYILLLDAPEDILLQRIAQKEIIEIDETPQNLRLMKEAYKEIRNSYQIARLAKTKWLDINSNKSLDELRLEVFSLIEKIISNG